MYDSLSGNAHNQGQLPETLKEDQLRINQIYSYWFCHLEGDKILYYSLNDKCLKTFDLSSPDSMATKWSADAIEVNPEFIHNFIWVHYVKDSNCVYMLHMLTNDKVAYDHIKENGTATRIAEVDCRNVNWMMKDKDRLFFACNTEGKNMPLYMAHKTGISKIQFDCNSDVTFIEFGYLKDNLMFLLYNEGEKATVGCYLLHLGAIDLENNPKIGETDEIVQKLTLHEQDDESIMADAYVLVNRIMQTITIATACNQLVTYRFDLDDQGKWKATEEMQDSSGMNMKSIATNFSLDKGSLLSFEQDDNEKSSMHIASHRLTDLKCLYFWFLQARDVDGKWNAAELGDVVELLA